MGQKFYSALHSSQSKEGNTIKYVTHRPGEKNVIHFGWGTELSILENIYKGDKRY